MSLACNMQIQALLLALTVALIEGQHEDTEVEWLYKMQHILSNSLNSMNGVEPVLKLDRVGIAGGAVIDVWLNQHCSLKNGSSNWDCTRCFHQNYNNVSGLVNCTRNYLPEEYQNCINFDTSFSNDIHSSEQILGIIGCFKGSLAKIEFNMCLNETLAQSGLQIENLDQLQSVKWCMKYKEFQFQETIKGEVFNRMFGPECGMTALALMNMIPMPFSQFERRSRIPEMQNSEVMRLLRNLRNHTALFPTNNGNFADSSRVPRMDFFEDGTFDWSDLAEFFN